jgi:LysR family hydrogen peroxide-inducible transcriptional activator
MSDTALTFKQLRVLLAIRDAKHFRRASEVLGVTQPALSTQLKNLEEILGAQLVERGRAGVALTPVGREVAQRASRILEEAQGLFDLTATAESGLVGTIRLGTTPTLGPYILPQVVSRLSKKHKDLHLFIHESLPKHLEPELVQGQHDVIFTQLPVVGAEQHAEPIFSEPLYLAVPKGHKLAKQDHVTARDMKGLDVLALGSNFHLHRQIHNLCDAVGAKVNEEYEGTSLDALRQMVGMGMGVTFLPATYVNSELTNRSEVIAKKVKGRTIKRTVSLVWRKSAGKATAYHQLADIIRDVISRRVSDITIL